MASTADLPASLALLPTALAPSPTALAPSPIYILAVLAPFFIFFTVSDSFACSMSRCK